MLPLTDSVTVTVNAPAERVWALITDVTRIGEFSPETLEGRWIGGATGPAVGAKFQGHVKRNGRGPMYWTTCRVVACEPNREFVFAVEAGGKAVNTWGYRLEPTEGGTAVTEFYRLTPALPLRIYWTLFGKLRAKTNSEGMRATLERIKAVAERP
ncbi:MAG: SRPBCC family protein [Sporichthyaceae bacterium]